MMIAITISYDDNIIDNDIIVSDIDNDTSMDNEN